MKIQNLTEKFGEVISSANILPLVLLYLILAISFVLFRMKNVEMDFISSANILPLVLLYLILAISFVLFRMKNVEMDYRIHDISKDIQKTINDGKDVKARKANLLSIERLRKLAKEFDLKEPKQSQVILIQ